MIIRRSNFVFSRMINLLIAVLMALCPSSICFAVSDHIGGVKSIDDRLSKLESTWQRLEVSGKVEVEAAYDSTKSNDAARGKNASSISAATVELGVDAGITDQIKGHMLLLYEDGEDDRHLLVDEVIIHIRALGVCKPDKRCSSPWYGSVGRMYVPFGLFNSHFISDPLTLSLGEIRAPAALIGLANDQLNLTVGAFNGAINMTDEQNDNIDNVVASLRYTLPEDVFPGIGLFAGVSYITDLAESKELQEQIAAGRGTATEFVTGVGAFASLSLMNGKLGVEAEYVAALDEFADGDLDPANFASGTHKPKAWNLEVFFAATEKLEVALKYEGGDDLGGFLPKKRFGLLMRYKLAGSASLAVEYLRGDLENNDSTDTATAQLAVTF